MRKLLCRIDGVLSDKNRCRTAFWSVFAAMIVSPLFIIFPEDASAGLVWGIAALAFIPLGFVSGSIYDRHIGWRLVRRGWRETSIVRAAQLAVICFVACTVLLIALSYAFLALVGR